jgi:hypothetical protein
LEEREMDAAAVQPSGDGDQELFPSSRLWLGMLGIIAVSGIAGVAASIAVGSGGGMCLLLIGVAVFGPAAALFYAARREVVLDAERLIVRPPKGAATLDLPWETIADARYELSPTGRYNQVRVTLTDGSEKLITEHQVRRLRQIATAIDRRRAAATTARRP